MYIKREQKVLRISLIAIFIIAVFGITYGVYINSEAIVFDSFFSFLTAVMTGLSLYVSKLLTKRGNNKYQYGFSHFEPVVNATNGFMMLIICIYAFVNGVKSILDGGNNIDIDVAIYYTIITSIASLAMYFYVKRESKIIKSDIIHVEMKEWLIASLLTIAIFIGFSIALIARHTEVAFIIPYIDPVVVSILAVVLVFTPIKIIITSLREIFYIAPSKLDKIVKSKMNQVIKKHEFEKFTSYVAKSGRVSFIEIHVLVPEETRNTKPKYMDKIRDEIVEELNEYEEKLWISICFTSDPNWLVHPKFNE
ncbi:cation diffusion facilitator family transporter [Aureivirga marina]|uniref:cation diffusion facilitator family transporter n=1 Tax=Aureivirga marina TaxID=1182451 RepID=UPI0018CAC124|nr:cation diffusion facilitator family transporter [Aureivirga marina]